MRRKPGDSKVTDVSYSAGFIMGELALSEEEKDNEHMWARIRCDKITYYNQITSNIVKVWLDGAKAPIGIRGDIAMVDSAMAQHCGNKFNYT